MSVIEQDYGCVTTSNNTKTVVGNYLGYTYPKTACETSIPSVWYAPTPLYQNKKGDDDMRYLYEVILVNPKDDEFEIFEVVAKTEASALMQAYNDSKFSNVGKISETLIAINVEFDELKTNCKVLMEWKKEKSLEKSLETIKKAVE